MATLSTYGDVCYFLDSIDGPYCYSHSRSKTRHL